MPVLELFFSLDSSSYIVTIFVVYEFLTVVFCCKTFLIYDLPMLWDSPNEIRSDSDVEYSSWSIRSYVGISWIHILQGKWRSWIQFRMTGVVIDGRGYICIFLVSVTLNLFQGLLIIWNRIGRCWNKFSMTSVSLSHDVRESVGEEWKEEE